ncbi:ubiquinone biosynthesis protein Coq4 [Choanephora cucurbitarum]|nr:ubiquinone biosynthesis protein Coq4 [Choanephora cucurbitarum]
MQRVRLFSRHILQRPTSRIGIRALTTSSTLRSSEQEYRNQKKLYETHIPISNIERTVLTIGSAFAALNNPLRGDMVAALGETTGHLFLSRMRDQMLESTVGRLILRERPIINTRTIDFDKLKQTCAPGTFGYTYIHWLEDQGVTPDTRCDVKYVDDEELAYVIKRYREIHDFFHTLTGLGVTVEEEIALKWFEWAQTGLPMTMMASLVGPARMSAAERHKLYTDYVPWALQCGSSCTPLMNVYYEEHFHTPLDEFRQQLGIILPPKHSSMDSSTSSF